MKRDSSIEKFTNNKIATSPTESDIMYRYKYKYLNNYQTENLSFETKKLIEKYDSKNDSNENLKYKNFNQLSNISKESPQDYKNYVYKDGDSYNILINKNKMLKRLFEQANCSLLISLQKQEKIEKRYENEKKEILDKLTKIQKNYEVYASGHQKMKDFKGKLNELTNSYNNMLKLYLKINSELEQFIHKITQIFNNINNFIEDNKEKVSKNILSFDYLLYIKDEMKEKFNIEKRVISKEKEYNNFEEDNICNQLKAYYTKKICIKDFTKMNEKVSNKFNISENI